MTNEIRHGKKYQHFFYRALTVSLGILLLSETVAANTLSSKIAQQPPATTSPSRNSQANNEGQKLLDEALELLKQGTSQSRTNAIAKYEQALAIGQKIGDRALVALALQGIGLTYVLGNNYPKALENYTQALAIRRALGDRLNEAFALNAVAGVYSNLGEKQKAIDYYNQSLTLFRAEKKSTEIASTLISLGGVYENLGDTAKVITSYNQALAIQRSTNDLLLGSFWITGGVEINLSRAF